MTTPLIPMATAALSTARAEPTFEHSPFPSVSAGPVSLAPSARADVSGSPEARSAPRPIPAHAKWGWALRAIPETSLALETASRPKPPAPGDVAVFRVERIGYHTSIVVRDGRKLRIYPGDLLVGVFGNRYATDGFEAEVDGVGEVALLTAAAMVGTVRSSHRDMGRSTTLSLVGFAVDPDGGRTNTKRRLFVPERAPLSLDCPVLIVVGTGMNAGKTTVVSQIIHDLTEQGLRVAAGKLTGSVSNRDSDEMRAASAASVIDFSDYGFPSTYLAEPSEISALWTTILAASARGRPDLMVMEIADGILERETAMMLADPLFGSHVSGVVLAADGPLSALAASERLGRLGYPLLAVSGALTSAPLAVREFREVSHVPVFPSTGGDSALAMHVLSRLSIPGVSTGEGLLDPTDGRVGRLAVRS